MAPQTSLAELCAWWTLRCSSWSMLNKTVYIDISSLTLLIGWQEGHLTCQNLPPANPKDSLTDLREHGMTWKMENTVENIKQEPKPVVAADLCVRTNVRWMWLNVERRSDDADADITVKSTSSQHVPTPVGQSSSTVAVSFVWYLMQYMTGFPSVFYSFVMYV